VSHIAKDGDRQKGSSDEADAMFMRGIPRCSRRNGVDKHNIRQRARDGECHTENATTQFAGSERFFRTARAI